MKIIIKPMGVMLLAAAVGGLGFLALRKPATSNPTVASPLSPAQAAPALSETASNTPASIRGHAIFRDGAENSWQTAGWTWAKDVRFDETNNTYAGAKAIRVKFTGYEGVKFHHEPLDTKPFDRITFMVHGGPKGGQLLQVGGICGEKTQGVSRKLPPLPAQKWASVTVSLADLKLANKPDMTAFWIQGNTDKAQADIYIDDVRLLVPGEPASPGTVLATSAM